MKPALVVYTHTDMKDVWNMFFGQCKKYMNDYVIYVCVNKQIDELPSEYTVILYDDSMPYTDRWLQLLPQIKEELILFLHEDMILLDNPDHELLELYTEFISVGRVSSVKLIFAGDVASPSFVHPTLVSNSLSKLSVQPTIIKKETFNNILRQVGSRNIWDFETAVSPRLGEFMVKVGTEKKRGMYHYDSQVFPYTATAINKGKWNYSEYKAELDILFAEYNIDVNVRGTV
jgi:hypothetical protein